MVVVNNNSRISYLKSTQIEYRKSLNQPIPTQVQRDIYTFLQNRKSKPTNPRTIARNAEEICSTRKN
jgi:hypothetical protein